MDRSDKNLPTSANVLQQNLDSNDTVKLKPSTFPTSFQLGVKFFKQDMSPVDDEACVVTRKKVNLPSEIDIIVNQEPCPLADSDVTSVHFTSTGGIMIIEEYSVTVNIPSVILIITRCMRLQRITLLVTRSVLCTLITFVPIALQLKAHKYQIGL